MYNMSEDASECSGCRIKRIDSMSDISENVGCRSERMYNMSDVSEHVLKQGTRTQKQEKTQKSTKNQTNP